MLLLTPMPLSNVAPAMVISMISLAYVEEDGLLLSAAFLAAIILIGIASAAVWGAIVGAILITAYYSTGLLRRQLMHKLRPLLLDQLSHVVGDF
jgi:hypothetical protein